MVSEFLAAPRRGRARLRGRIQRLALQQGLAQLRAEAREQAQARPQALRAHLQQQLPPAQKPRQRRAAHQRVQLRVGRTPLLLRALAVKKGRLRPPEKKARAANQRRVLRQGTAATPGRALKLSDLSLRDPTNRKATLAHASRVPTPDNLTLTNPAQAKRRLEHIIARKQANAKAVVRPRNLKDNNKQFEF